MKIWVALYLIAGTYACLGGGGGGCCSSASTPPCGNPCGGGIGTPIGGYARPPLLPSVGPAPSFSGAYVAPPIASLPLPPPPPPPLPVAPILPPIIGAGVQPIPLFGQSVGGQTQGYAAPSSFSAAPQPNNFGSSGYSSQSSAGLQPAAGFSQQQPLQPAPSGGYAQPMGGFSQQQNIPQQTGGFSQPSGGYIQPSGVAAAIQQPYSPSQQSFTDIHQGPGGGGSYQTEPSSASAPQPSAPSSFNQQPAQPSTSAGEQNYDDEQGGESQPAAPHPSISVSPSVDAPSVSVPEPEPETPSVAPIEPVPSTPQPAPQPSVNQPSQPETTEAGEEGEEYGDEEQAPEVSHQSAPLRPPIQPSIQISTSNQPIQPQAPHVSEPSNHVNPKPIRIVMKPVKNIAQPNVPTPVQPSTESHEIFEEATSHEAEPAVAPVATSSPIGGLDFNKVNEDLSSSKTRSTIPGATRFTTAAPQIDTVGGDEDYSDVEPAIGAQVGEPTNAGDGTKSAETDNLPHPQPAVTSTSSHPAPSHTQQAQPKTTNSRLESLIPAGNSKAKPVPAPASAPAHEEIDAIDAGSDYDSVPPTHEDRPEIPTPAQSFSGSSKNTPESSPNQEIVEPNGFDYGAGSDYHEPEPKKDPKIVNSENEAKATSGDNAYPENRLAGTKLTSVGESVPLKAELYPVESSYYLRRRI